METVFTRVYLEHQREFPTVAVLKQAFKAGCPIRVVAGRQGCLHNTDEVVVIEWAWFKGGKLHRISGYLKVEVNAGGYVSKIL
jgi:hypothetical protein